MLSMNSFAQFSEMNMANAKGWSLGLVKNDMLFADYGLNNGLHFQLKQSLIADELKQEYDVLSVSYKLPVSAVELLAEAFAGTDWHGSYLNAGSRISIAGGSEGFKIGAAVIPYYDSDLDYQTGWSFAASAKLYKDISLFGEFGRQPEYRIAYNRAYLGFDIKYAHLDIKPMLQIPCYDSGVRLDHSKVVVSLSYNFK